MSNFLAQRVVAMVLASTQRIGTDDMTKLPGLTKDFSTFVSDTD